MATALFISRATLVKNTALGGNVDPDKFMQFIKIAQEIHIQNFLGTKLYDKISNDILASTLSGNYLSLVETYVQPMLIHFAMVEYMPFAAYTIANNGVYRHTTDTSESVNKEEVDFLIAKEQKIADYYTRRFLDYMTFNQQLFPEYNQNNNEDVYPEKDSYFSSWVL
jgi:hypothetical protein